MNLKFFEKSATLIISIADSTNGTEATDKSSGPMNPPTAYDPSSHIFNCFGIPH